jgi:hypothetical protein
MEIIKLGKHYLINDNNISILLNIMFHAPIGMFKLELIYY